MILETWFAQPIWYDDLDCDFSVVKQGCLRQRRQDQGRQYSNVGGWQSHNIILADHPEFQDLDRELNRHISAVCQEIHPDFKVKMDNLWININQPQDYNTRHIHAQSTLSGALYVDVDDDSGELIFVNSSHIMHYAVSESDLFTKQVRYKPRVGMLVIFPSWLEHEVRSSPRSQQERISMSFNLSQLRPKNG